MTEVDARVRLAGIRIAEALLAAFLLGRLGGSAITILDVGRSVGAAD